MFGGDYVYRFCGELDDLVAYLMSCHELGEDSPGIRITGTRHRSLGLYVYYSCCRFKNSFFYVILQYYTPFLLVSDPIRVEITVGLEKQNLGCLSILTFETKRYQCSSVKAYEYLVLVHNFLMVGKLRQGMRSCSVYV